MVTLYNYPCVDSWDNFVLINRNLKQHPEWIHAVDERKRTPLHLAIRDQSNRGVKLLLRAGANMNVTVVWTEVVPGHVYMETTVVDDGLQCQRISSVDGVGFQFSQARGIVILNTPFGLVACLPIGMSLVSSVTITAEVGTALQKGDEFAYFTFGGSDYVCLFDSRISVHLTATVGTHYLQGTCIGYLDAE